MDKKDEKVYVLSKKQIYLLLIYYFILILVSIVVMIRVICELYKEINAYYVIKKSIEISIATAVTFCTIKYIRVIYLACIHRRIKDEKNISEIGNFIYFLFRPIFALIFSIILVATVLSGLFLISGGLDIDINNKIIYLCCFLSVIIGYSVGKCLDFVELISIKLYEKLKKEER